MEMTVEAEAIWIRILKQLAAMQRDIRVAQQHTPGTGKNAWTRNTTET